MARGQMNGPFKELPTNSNWPKVFGQVECICGKTAFIKIDGHGMLFSYCDKNADGCGTKITTTSIEGIEAMLARPQVKMIAECAGAYRNHLTASKPKPIPKKIAPIFVEEHVEPETIAETTQDVKPDILEIGKDQEPPEPLDDEEHEDFTE